MISAGPHDAFFKWTFEQPEHAASLLRATLPAATVAAIEWSSLTCTSESFVDPSQAARYTDLLFTARLAGRPACVYVLVEHQSTSDDDMPRRMLTYISRVWERFRRDHETNARLPLVVPVVIAHDPRGWSAPRSMAEQIDADHETLAPLARHLPLFDLLIEDLAAVDDEQLRTRALGALPRVALALLRDSRDDARLLRALASWADTLLEILRAPSGFEAMRRVLEYIVAVSDIPANTIHATIKATIPEAEPVVMTLAERLRQEGREQGLEKGREQGREQGLERGREQGRRQGQAEMLLRLLEAKFGSLDDEVRTRVEAASEAELARLSLRVVTVDTLDEVFAN